MALTLTTTAFPFRDRTPQLQVRQAVITGPASYATGGVAIDNIGDFGWGETYYIDGYLWNGTTRYDFVLDRTNQKIIITDGTGVQVSNATDLSAFSGLIQAFGK